MKTINKVLFAAVLIGLLQSAIAAPWVYRGSLSDGGKEANGQYDLRVTVLDANGAVLAQAVTLNNVSVQKGIFTTHVDFGVDVASFPGAKIKTEVQQGGSGFVQLGDAKTVAAPNGGDGQCWSVTGNTTTSPTSTFPILGTIDASSDDKVFLQVRGENKLLMRASGGVETANSDAFGLNSMALGSSVANGAGSFTVGSGRTSAPATNSFVYSSTASATLPGAFSNAPNEFLVRADGGIGFNFFPNDTSASVTIGLRPGSTNTRMVLRNDVLGESIISFVNGPLASEFGDIGFRYSNGGFFINAQTLDATANRLEIFANGSAAVVTNGGSFQNASSRAFKEGFQTVNPAEILAKVVSLPLTTWTYKGSDEGIHMGPIAEDFKEIFNLSGNGKGISTVDANGVALAAIQGLNNKLQASEQQNAALKARLDALEARLK
jgi:hypothetical protein